MGNKKAGFPDYRASYSQGQQGDVVQRDEQAVGGQAFEQLSRPGEARRRAGGGDRQAHLLTLVAG